MAILTGGINLAHSFNCEKIERLNKSLESFIVCCISFFFFIRLMGSNIALVYLQFLRFIEARKNNGFFSLLFIIVNLNRKVEEKDRIYTCIS